MDEALRSARHKVLSRDLEHEGAVEMFVDYKVSQLASIEQDNALQDKVRNQMHEKANGTFLWVALVFQELEQADSWDVLQSTGRLTTALRSNDEADSAAKVQGS